MNCKLLFLKEEFKITYPRLVKSNIKANLTQPLYHSKIIHLPVRGQDCLEIKVWRKVSSETVRHYAKIPIPSSWTKEKCKHILSSVKGRLYWSPSESVSSISWRWMSAVTQDWGKKSIWNPFNIFTQCMDVSKDYI